MSMSFTMEQMESLTALGYSGDFIENISSGDLIAMNNWRYNEAEGITFLTVDQVKLVPAGEGHHLVQFIGIHENGVREPMTYGQGWAIFRKFEL